MLLMKVVLRRLSVVVAVCCVTLSFGAEAASTKVSFNKDVLPILQENCQLCHRPGGANMGGMVAPMAFTTYEETRPWAKSMAKKVANREMPPWHAAPEQHGVFENERTLAQDQIDVIVAWAKQGARRGDPKDAPEPLEWPDNDGWTIGEPDLIISMPEPYFVDDDVEDIYRDFESVISSDMLPEERIMKAIEFRPGSSAVHHIIALPLGGIAPGNDPSIYPDGIGVKLSPGTTVRWQMHYHKEPGPGTGVYDQSQAAIRFYPKGAKIDHILNGNPLGRFDFAIPAGDPNYSVQSDFTFPHDSQIIALMPHMHLRGKSAKYEAFYPDGNSEVILDVPRYDFNWQTSYKFKEFKQMPAGTRIVLTTAWDNSADNPYNPDPTKTIGWGEPTTSEMSFGWMSYIDDSGEAAPMFGNRGRGRGIDLVQVISMFDSNHDGMLQEEEAPGRMKRFFHMMDTNGDGNVDVEEAKIAQERFQKSQRERSSGTD